MQDEIEQGNSSTTQETSEEMVPKSKFDEVHGRATRAEAKLKEALPTQESAVDPFDLVADNLSLMRDLSNEELEAIRARAKALKISPSALLQDELGKTLIKTMRQDKQVAETTPAPSSRVVGEGETLVRVGGNQDVVLNKDGKPVKTDVPSFREWDAKQRSKNTYQ